MKWEFTEDYRRPICNLLATVIHDTLEWIIVLILQPLSTGEKKGF